MILLNALHFVDVPTHAKIIVTAELDWFHFNNVFVSIFFLFWGLNTKGTRTIIDLCIRHNVPNLIYTSTALVSL